MNTVGRKSNEDLKTLGLVIGGILINILFANIASLLKLPFYLDCIGTISAAITAGFLPGVLVGFFTNVLMYFFNTYVLGAKDDMTLYYSVVSVLIAIVAAAFAQKKYFKMKKNIRH